jgi:hypothetical protein
MWLVLKRLFDAQELAESMGKVLDDLERQSLETTQRSPTGRLTLGFDYVVVFFQLEKH